MAHKRQADSPAPGVDPDALLLEAVQRIADDPAGFHIDAARGGDAEALAWVFDALVEARAAGVDPDPRLIAFESEYQTEARNKKRPLRPAPDPDGKPKRGRGRPGMEIESLMALVRRIVYLRSLGHTVESACERAAAVLGCDARTAQRVYYDLTLRDMAERKLMAARDGGFVAPPKPEDLP